ncbi:hypothetical protein [Luteimonas rhizosphaerae]|nr:hypothetical protein [Luteimonas sp. 4-12]
MFAVVFARSAVLAFGDNSDRASLFVMSREARSLRQLTEHADDLRRMAQDIDSVSLREIRSTTERTVSLVDRANAEISAQIEAWERTRGKIKQDEHAYTTLRAQIAATEKLQAQEIARLQQALEGATSTRQRMLEILVSLITGVLGSIIAAALFPKLSIRGLKKLVRWGWSPKH